MDSATLSAGDRKRLHAWPPFPEDVASAHGRAEAPGESPVSHFRSGRRLLKVLLVVDSPHDAESVVRHLEESGYDADWIRVDREADFRLRLHPGLDVILCDCQLAEFDCTRALGLLQESALPVPLVVLAGSIAEESAVAAIRNGAADYLLKDRLGRVGQAVEHAVEQCRLRHEHRNMMEALLQAEARYRGIFENAVEGIFQATPEGRLMAANPALSRVLGYPSPKDTIAMVDDILAQLCPDAARLSELRLGLERSGLVTGFETQASCPDGSSPWLSLNCRMVREPGGAMHLEGTVEDITERKTLESQLLRAQRLDSVGRLAGGIAHDLNNILLPILISPGVLRERLKDPEAREIVDSIEVSARRGADIVRQLLTFSRGTDGERVPVQLRNLVNEMISIMRETFPKTINLRSSLPVDTRVVRGDPTQLHQVIMNLCVNARDAMPRGGVLRIAIENVEVDDALAKANAGARPGPHVALSVSDTGTGIAPAHLDKIFDPFFTTKEVGQGTGLGLSTVLGIVNSHGGFIQIDSVVDRGTTFRVYFPATKEESVHHLDTMDNGPRGAGELVLLVDDERAVRHATRTILESRGYQVVEATDGEDALARIEQLEVPVDVAVVDLLMPRMDGVEFIRALRCHPDAPAIVAMTGVGRSPKVDRIRELGGIEILEKPFTADLLLQTLATLLKRDPGMAGTWGW